MPEGQLNHLTNLGHLFPASADIVITDLVKVVLFILSLYGFALAVNDSILSDDTELWRIHLDNLELNLPHTTSNNEEIALANRSVGLSEVGGKENVEERTSKAFYGIRDGEDCDSLGL